MPAQPVAPKLLSWASTIEPETVAQAARAARLPIVEGHVALMPDAHVGIGARGRELASVVAHLKDQFNVEMTAVCDLWSVNRERAVKAGTA